MSVSLFSTIVAATMLLGPQKLGEPRKLTAPESFSASAHVAGTTGASAATITMQVQRYTPDADREAVERALSEGGYPAFLLALRKAPVVGTITLAGQSFNVRWARQQIAGRNRTIVLVTDSPMFFAGGGSVKAKPREGYEVGLLQFKIDDTGVGMGGTMAAAARVKPGGESGVQVDDYAEKPIELRTLRRDIK